MKHQLKMWWIIPFFLVLIAIIWYAHTQEKINHPIISFRLSSDQQVETIHAWQKDDIYYVFLPSYADPSCLTAEIGSGYQVTANQIVLTDTTDFSVFEENLSYPMEISWGLRKRHCAIEFLHSSNVASIFIDTETGDMRRVHENKNKTENIRISVHDSKGTLEYSSESDIIKGRGNASWEAEKKPYLLTLSGFPDLFGMGSAEKWILLANAYDTSNLRNMLIYDLAEKVGLEGSPQCSYVDLYLNGEYAGLYLLTEKIEIQENRLNIVNSDANEPTNFLCRCEVNSRFDILNNPILTNFGRVIEISSPETCSDVEKARIAADVQLMEDAILSEDASNSSLEILDLDSWVRKYLLEEIAGNFDADRCSSYFYCKYENGLPKFYAGPAWDYDAALGRESTLIIPRSFMANKPWEAEDSITPYFTSLYKKDIFYRRVCELYQEEFFPILQNLLAEGIEEQANTIAAAGKMNAIRWSHSEADTAGWEQVHSFLQQRVEFLNEAWIQNILFYTVKVQPYGETWIPFRYYAMREGELLTDLPVLQEPKGKEPVWIDQDTGEPFDFSKSIQKDTTLILQNEKITFKESPIAFILEHKHRMLDLFLVGVLGLVFLLLMWIDFRHNKPWRWNDAKSNQ